MTEGPTKPPIRERYREPVAGLETTTVVSNVDPDHSDGFIIAASLPDPPLFGVIFDRHFDTIHRYLARRVGVPDADDLAGDVFRVAFERRARFDLAVPNARPWLYGIATNLLVNHRRAEHRHLQRLERIRGIELRDLTAGEFTADIDDRLDRQARLGSVRDALGGLADGDRDALVLFAVEELTYAEVAVALDIPIGTVRSRINRARRITRELITSCEQQLDNLNASEEPSHG